MNKITLYKKFSDGNVRSIEANDKKEGVMHLMSNGYFLTEKEAQTGKLQDVVVQKQKSAAKAAPKAAPKVAPKVVKKA